MGRKTDTNSICDIIEEALQNAGISFESNCGTIWIDGGDGVTYAISPTECESDEGRPQEMECPKDDVPMGKGDADKTAYCENCATEVPLDSHGRCACCGAVIPQGAETHGETPSADEPRLYRVTWNEVKMCATELEATSSEDAIAKVREGGWESDQYDMGEPESVTAFPIDPDEAD